MDTYKTVDSLRRQVADWRRQGLRIGFVPTMGNLHAGHFALVDLARQHSDKVVASIFVNPTQFGPNEDYARYPRTPDSDIAGLASKQCDALLLPSVEEMYPFGTIGCVQMHVPGITDILCGAHRPGHFNGVAQVVARLFNMVQPDVAVFGRKDYQQLQVIRYMTREMSFPVQIVPAPTLRETDGLAMSSRNQRLGPEDRARAARLYQALRAVADRAFRVPVQEALQAGRQVLDADPTIRTDHLALARVDDLRPLEAWTGVDEAVVLVAAQVGPVRLIDNITVHR